MRLLRKATAVATFLKAIALHPDTPLRAKIIAGGLVAYALSPIDILPDFLPGIGQLDDVLLMAAGVWLITRMVPPHVLRECKVRDKQTLVPE